MPDQKLTYRLRRLRSGATLRSMLRETRLHASDFVLPLFVSEKIESRQPVASMPGVDQFTVDEAVEVCREARGAELHAVILFGIPKAKDDRASQAYAEDGIVQRAVAAIKDAVPDLVVITDVCLCEYMDHGHCGIVAQDGDHHEILNDDSVELLERAAVSHAAAGADMVAPSDMMDGRVLGIRGALDDAGFDAIPIMSYAAKFSSAFYGPFRDAGESAPAFGDRRSYQMDPANGREAMREVEQDIAEGADIVMVKPGLAYLDVLAETRDLTDLPVAVYNVSGEYSMVKAAAEKGWIDEKATVLELMTAFKRAGADFILTYWARELLDWIRE